ncbi:MAG: adhesin, partial [Methanobrevibacter sp.]|nr:adhesin [Methanobrevibacter sp.]
YSNNITVLSTIVASNYKTTYLTGGKFTFKVVDGQGNPLANQKAKLNINGVFYDRTTDENGTASLTINLRPADYICTVTANGLSQSYTVTVNKGTPSLSLVSTTVKTGDKFQCKISYNGKPVAGTLIYFIFNGTTPYGAYSDSNGIAGVTIGLPAGNYLFYVGTQNDPLFTNTLIGTTLVVK